MHEIRVNVQSAKERKRTAILDAAEQSLARVGYAQLTMERIAEEAGVARRTVYLYFRGKEEAVLGTVDRIVDRVIARLTSLATSQAPAADRLLRMLVERVIIRAESVQGYHQALDGLFASLRAPLLERRRAYFAREAGLLAAVLREGQRAGEFGAGKAQKTADLLILCTNALLPHGLSAADVVDRAGLERRARSVAQLLLEGVRRRPIRKKGN
jgi:AcrR family transcriptional regulator